MNAVSKTSLSGVAGFAANPRRRALLAKVHIAPKQLRMDDDSYRAVLLRETGQISASQCTEAQLETLVKAFERLGFRAVAAARPGGRSGSKPGAARRADHPVARKARAMWISLGYLCAIDDPKEGALEAFAKRQLGCSTLQWANQAQGDRLIEALKAIAERHGWEQSLAGIGKAHHVHALKVRLAQAILAKLKRAAIVPAEWSLAVAALKLCGIGAQDDGFEPVFATEQLDLVNASLGAKLRAHGGVSAFAPVNEEADA